MSRVKVNEITNKVATGPVDFPDGITGVALTVTGNVTVGGTIISEDTTNVDSVGFVTARSGLNVGPPSTGIGATIHSNGNAVFAGIVTTGNLTAGNLTAGNLTATGDANITGVATAGGGFEVGAAGVGGTITSVGNAEFVGIVTAAGGLRCNDGASNGLRIGDGEDLIIQHNGTNSFIDNNTGDLYVQTTGSGDDVFVQPADALYLQSGGANTRLLVNGVGSFTFDNGTFIEKCKITAGKLSDNQDIDLLDGMVHYFTTQESTTAVPNLRESASRTLGDAVNTGDIVTVNIITTAAAAGYSAQLTIDGNAVTEEWIGGSAPSAGSSDGLDIYVYSCIRIGSGTGDSGWKVIANLTNATN
tara:strand:+ start:4559 stop:5635 length:1077 start_codon:yes stop_codon:yes gene_type:complete